MSPKATSSQPAAASALGDLQHAVDRHLALVRAAEAGRDHALAAQPLGPGALDHALETGERLGDRAVDVLAVVGLGGGEEEVDLVEAVALRERALEPALVRDQDRVGDPGAALVGGEHLLGVGELRDHVGAHERGELDPPQPRLAEHVDQPHLLVGRDHLGLVLKAVARPDLADPHALGERAHPSRGYAARDGGESRFDAVGLEPHLRAGEAQRRQAGGRVSLVSEAVASLLHGRAVIAEAVRLDHEAEFRPEEIDPVAIDALLRERRRQAGRARDREERALELRVREREGRTIEQRPKAADARLAGCRSRAARNSRDRSGRVDPPR